MHYRPEIDGLRALAVVPVILFHAGFDAFRGGFVGVDVFFVISGYLISTILMADLEKGKFSIVTFYERRARRILPALFLMMFVSLPLAWFSLLPWEMKSFSQSVMAVSGFSSNVLFRNTSGYFDVAAELKPLLHTWSLAVEEQYYVVFPILLAVLWRFGRRWVVGVLATTFVISFAVAQYQSLNEPVAAFYLLPARGWELLIGVFVALFSKRLQPIAARRWLGEAGALFGLALIVYAMARFDERTPFPGVYALVPTVGTALVVLFATERTIVGRILGTGALVGIGLVSYSAYLWHQPMFAFVRSKSVLEPSQLQLGALAVLALVFAYLSWRFVEAPFRDKRTVSRPQIFRLAGAGTVFFLIVGGIGNALDGFSYRLPSNIVWQSLGQKLEVKGDVCVPRAVTGFDGLQACAFGDTTSMRTIILYGDSHAQAIFEELHKGFRRARVRGLRVRLPGCDIVPDIHSTSDITNLNRNCAGPFGDLLRYIEANDADVVLASRWTFRLFPIEGEIEEMPYRNSEGGAERDSAYREYAVVREGRLYFDAANKREAMRRLFDGLLSSGARLFVVYPIPEIGWNIARANMDFYAARGAAMPELSIPYGDFIKRNRFVHEVFQDYEGRDQFVPIRPETYFCNSYKPGRCVAQYGSIPLYYDDDHLSDEGAGLVVSEIIRQLGQESS